MKYLVINPYSQASHGIANYIKTLKSSLSREDVIYYENSKNLSAEKFREDVYNYITTRYGYDEIIIEAPEAKASTLLLPKEYKVHIRLHCPLAIAQKYDNKKPNQQEYSSELRVINKAFTISSPSYALVTEMKDELRRDDLFFYKNPIDINIKTKDEIANDAREYDVIFMGRFQELKGTDHLNKILENLPENYNVLLFGKNSNLFKKSKDIKCDVKIRGEIKSEERFDLIKNSKCLILPSNFENCSMVILESLACNTPIVAWDVGGNSEIAKKEVIQCAKFEDYYEFSNRVIDFVENKVDTSHYNEAIDEINNDFKNGISSIIKYSVGESREIYKGLDKSLELTYTPIKTKKETSKKNHKKLRVFGVAFSNEHIEELWAPVIDHLKYEYRYVSRRPLGYHSVFKHPPYPIKKEWVCCFDWTKDDDRLIQQIKNYKPNVIFFHNGSHPTYQKTIQKIKELKIPLIYSELGWFPQKDHVYFDRWGVNGKSFIASLSAEQLCNNKLPNPETNKELNGQYALIVTQLENDTNLIVNSPRFKNNEKFISHVINELKDRTKIIICPHPLDKNIDRYSRFESENVQLSRNGDTLSLLKHAHSVIGINSTVLLQSLNHEINIYSYGYSILDNKNVAISCINHSISELWKDTLYGCKERRNAIIDNLKLRQLNLIDLRKGQKPTEDSISPITESGAFDFSTIIKEIKDSDKKKEVASEFKNATSQEISTQAFTKKGMNKRKLNKLIRNPRLFLLDMILKRTAQ